MPKHQLGELLDEAKKRNLTLRKIEAKSHGKLKIATMSGWRTADEVNLECASILALADALEIPPVMVFLAAIGQLAKLERKDRSGKELIDAFADLLTKHSQQARAIEKLKQKVQERLLLDGK